MTGKREDFKPTNPPKVLFYSCGPTVYGPLHIGNARALIVADLIYRWMLHIGYDVNFVRNYTDVDDRIIERANQENTTAADIAQKYIDYCEVDISLLGLKAPTKTVRVTETMPEIVQMIETIIERGHAYVAGEEVLFSIESFAEYGKLSGKKVEDLQAGARVEVDHKKKNPLDFTLWKPHKKGEPYWDSPWGKGRPGWHIECSAMVKRWLGETIDLHHGGPDLIFPHHENEIAQSETANGVPFCNHWVHHAFLTMSKEKMSKSLGNFITTREFIENYDAETLKFIYLNHHYRSMVEFSDSMIMRSIDELERIYLLKKWAEKTSIEKSDAHSSEWKALLGKAQEVFKKIEEECLVDLNTPGALGHLFGFIRDVNRTEAQLPEVKSIERQTVAVQVLELLEDKIYKIMNVFGEKADHFLKRIDEIRKAQHTESHQISDEQIQSLIQARKIAREQKDYKRADDIRVQLETKGILLVDSAQGTTWKYK